MPEQLSPFNPKDFKDAIRQLQALLDDLYNERLAGAQAGDVLAIDNTSDILTLTLASASGLTKTNGELAVLPNPSGCVTVTASGVDVSPVSTTKKGAAPKLPNDATKYLDGTGAFSIPAGTIGASGTIHLVKLTGGGADGSITVVNGLITAFVDPT